LYRQKRTAARSSFVRYVTFKLCARGLRSRLFLSKFFAYILFPSCVKTFLID